MQELHLVQDLENSDYIFLIVNPLSGGRAAGQLLNLGFNFLQFKRQNSFVKLFIGDIRTGVSGDKTLFHIIKAIADRKREVKIVVAGGDGTVSWAFAEIEAHHISANKVVVGVLPFGTGNDFANATGTNSHIFKLPNEEPISQMKRLCETWLTMTTHPFDLWEVEIILQPNGVLKKVDSTTKQKVVLDHPSPLKLAMLNYFSFGVESRIGLGFDRNRTNNPYLNRGAYAMEGFKKFAFHRTQFIDNLIEGLHLRSDENTPPRKATDEDVTHVFRCRPMISKTERLATLIGTAKERLFVTNDDSAIQDTLRSPFSSPTHVSRAVSLDTEMDDLGGGLKHPFLKPCVSLLFLNIGSFAGGLDPWAAAEGKMGVRLPSTKSDVEACIMRTCCETAEQDFGDGNIEVIGFQSLVELSLTNLERILPAHIAPGGWRIYQGGGPFVIPFRRDLPRDLRIYFQVDGEYFLAQLLDRVNINPLRKVRVLAIRKRRLQTR